MCKAFVSISLSLRRVNENIGTKEIKNLLRIMESSFIQ